MNRTGVCPRETLATRIALKVLGLAAAGLLFGLGTEALAKDYDPYQPRTEEVLDADGSVWKVLIVPLSQPAMHPAALNVLPQDAPKTAAPPSPEKPAAYEAAPKQAPAPAEKTADAKAPETKEEKAPAETAEPKAEAEPKEIKSPYDNPFGIEIVPRFSYPALPPAALGVPIGEHGVKPVSPWDYAWIYHSIPFLRSEYIANPSYRHEAAMEMLFGELRPTVVHKHPGEPRPHATLFPFENNYIQPYSYYSLGPGTGYGRGPLPFAAPGAYGVNYNFYWPMPTVYRNY